MSRFDREGNRLEPPVMVICLKCFDFILSCEYTDDGDKVYICECGNEEIY